MKTFTLTTLAAALWALASAQAQPSNSFTGTTGSQWNTAGNWSLGTVPASGDNIYSVLGTEARIGNTTAAVANNLTVGGASGTSIVSLRNDSANSLTVSGSITLAPGAGIGQLNLGVSTGFTSTLTIGGGSGSILDGGGAGSSKIAIYGSMGTLGLASITVDELNVNQNSSGSLTIGSGQTYTVGTTKVGSATANVTDALTVNGTLVGTTSITIGASAGNGVNDATFTLNTGGLVRTPTLTRGNTQNTTFNWNGGTIQNPSGGNLVVSAGSSTTLTISVASSGTHNFDVESGRTVTVNSTALLADQPGQNGTLTKTGAGTLALQSANTYSGNTTISEGSLNLSGSGSIANSPTISISSGATLNGGASFTLGASQTLKGNGTVTGSGNLTLNGTVSPGTSIGTLTFGYSAALGGTTLMEINSSASPNADRINASSGTLTFGGTLTITNIGGAPTNGTVFNLFDGTLSGTFATVNLPPGGGTHWLTSDLNLGGTITFTNNAPVASAISMGAWSGLPQTLTVVGGHPTFAPTDSDPDSLTLSSVTTPGSGTASISNGTNIIYTSAANYAGTNSFDYVVTDNLGGYATNTVTVVVSNLPAGYNQLSPSGTITNGTVTLTFAGIPNYPYALDWATNLSAPVNWQAVITNNANTNGIVNFTNTSAAPENYFRTRQP